MNSHRTYMNEAISIAHNNPQAPYGALLVYDDAHILASSYNTSYKNPIMHGELSVIHDYFSNANSADVSKICLYTTAEPCPMCMSAVYWAKIPKVVYGSNIPFLNALFNTQIDIRASEVLQKTPDFFNCSLIGSVLEEQCNQLFLEAYKLGSNQLASNSISLHL